MRHCSRCLNEKPIDEFALDKRKPEGRAYECRECNRIRNRLSKQALANQNREKERLRVKRRYHENKETILAYQKSLNKSPKVRARRLLSYAVRVGKIQKPNICECGNIGNLHGHHSDYSKPLDVEWLCSLCHGKQHRQISLPLNYSGHRIIAAESEHGRTKLTIQDVINIRQLGDSTKAIATAFGISSRHVLDIRNGKKWKYLANYDKVVAQQEALEAKCKTKK